MANCEPNPFTRAQDRLEVVPRGVTSGQRRHHEFALKARSPEVVVASAHLQLDHLGDPPPLPLRSRQVAALAARWGGPTSRKGRAWADIEALAASFLACDKSDAKPACLVWHHLLLAVGNFKRRGGVILPPSLGAMEQVQVDSCLIPVSATTFGLLSLEDRATWAKLTDTPGVGIPTATTLLSALFPGSHVIIDRRATRAAIGISAGELWDVTGLNRHELPDVASPASYWQLYTYWYRPVVLATADAVGCEPVTAERALYCLDELTKPRLDRNWVWTDYLPKANEWLDDARES